MFRGLITVKIHPIPTESILHQSPQVRRIQTLIAIIRAESSTAHARTLKSTAALAAVSYLLNILLLTSFINLLVAYIHMTSTLLVLILLNQVRHMPACKPSQTMTSSIMSSHQCYLLRSDLLHNPILQRQHHVMCTDPSLHYLT